MCLWPCPKCADFRSACAWEKYHPGMFSPFVCIVVSNDSFSEQWRPWSDCADAQADLGLRCPHTPEDTFLQGASQSQILRTLLKKKSHITFKDAIQEVWCKIAAIMLKKTRVWHPLTTRKELNIAEKITSSNHSHNLRSNAVNAYRLYGKCCTFLIPERENSIKLSCHRMTLNRRPVKIIRRWFNEINYLYQKESPIR